MILFDLMVLAFKHMRRLKFRSWSTIIGIVISIAAIVALTSISQGTRESILNQFESIGANKAIIFPTGNAFFTDKDVNTIKRVNGVKQTIPFITSFDFVEYKKEKIPVIIRCLPTDKNSLRFGLDSNIIKVLKGRYLKENDRRVAFINYYLAYGDDFNKRNIKIGDKISINGVNFKVIGIQQKTHDQSHSLIIRIPLEDGKKALSMHSYTGIGVIFEQDIDKQKVVERIKKALRKERGIHNEKNDDFTITLTENIIKNFNKIMILLQWVVIGIVSISLLIGGIGIANTMFASVLERTKEIGTLKSIGARNSTIFFLFLLEAGFLGLLGGIIGIISGWLFSILVERISVLAGLELKTHVSTFLIIFSMGFSFLVGVVSGIAPAIRAMRLKPIDALRYE